MVDGFVQRELSFDGFARAYSDQFLERIPDESLSRDEWEYFGAIHERIEWTGPHPTDEERKLGWMSVEELRLWLVDHIRKAP
jgi:hypothetical protein